MNCALSQLTSNVRLEVLIAERLCTAAARSEIGKLQPFIYDAGEVAPGLGY